MRMKVEMAEQHEDKEGFLKRSDMTLRDYFAGQAMDTILKKLYEMAERTGERYDNVYRIASVASYEYADAMLEARK